MHFVCHTDRFILPKLALTNQQNLRYIIIPCGGYKHTTSSKVVRLSYFATEVFNNYCSFCF